MANVINSQSHPELYKYTLGHLIPFGKIRPMEGESSSGFRVVAYLYEPGF